MQDTVRITELVTKKCGEGMERKQTYLRAVHCNNPSICDPVYGTDFP